MGHLYKAQPGVDLEGEELFAYLQREFEAIERSFLLVLPTELEELHAAPAKVRSGMIVFADGTDWNPGSGQGIYAYYAAAWHKLG